MTSKEAVLELICEAKSLNRDDGRVCFLRKVIEKDLEVLEILKRMVIVRKGNTWYYLDTEHPFFESQEDIDKVKEWLENEKRRIENNIRKTSKMVKK